MQLEQIAYLIFITLLPGVELRGSIPFGILVMQLDPILVFFVCVVANILLIPPVYIFLKFIFPYFENLSFVKPLVKKIRDKTNNYVDKYGFLGLTIFVAIPFPGTGAYSGLLGAHLLGIRKRIAVPAITLGVIIAGILVALASIGVFDLFGISQIKTV